MKTILVTAFVLVLVCAFSPAHANLVVNGGFETGNFSGWTQIAASTGSDYRVDSALPHSGTYAAVFGAASPNDTITQPLATIPGQSYTFSFWLQRDPNPGFTNNNNFYASWNGSVVFSLVNSGPFSYTEHSFTEVAAGSSTTISFAAYDAPARLHLDDVSVNPVPIPGALLLFGPGFVGLAAIRRRFKK